MSEKPKRPRDPSLLGKFIVEAAINKKISSEVKVVTKNSNAVALGQKGGAARAKSLSSEQRQSIAKKAAKARWKKS